MTVVEAHTAGLEALLLLGLLPQPSTALFQHLKKAVLRSWWSHKNLRSGAGAEITVSFK